MLVCSSLRTQSSFLLRSPLGTTSYISMPMADYPQASSRVLKAPRTPDFSSRISDSLAFFCFLWASGQSLSILSTLKPWLVYKTFDLPIPSYSLQCALPCSQTPLSMEWCGSPRISSTYAIDPVQIVPILPYLLIKDDIIVETDSQYSGQNQSLH